MHPIEKANRLNQLTRKLSPVAETMSGVFLGSTGGLVELVALDRGWDESIRTISRPSENVILPIMTYPFNKAQEMNLSPVVVATTYMGISAVLVVDGIRRIVRQFRSMRK